MPGRYAVCRLEPGSPIPDWADSGAFSSVTRTPDEVSIIGPELAVPALIRAERGWRVLRVVGTQEFSLVGVLASLVEPLARAGISLFAQATFDTDYLLIKEEKLDLAITTLNEAGHRVVADETTG